VLEGHEDEYRHTRKAPFGGELPSLPVVALEVLRLARSETASAAEIARTIELDPALASKVLKVANWPCSDVPPDLVGAAAMRILGLRTVKVMALTFSLTTCRPSVKRL